MKWSERLELIHTFLTGRELWIDNYYLTIYEYIPNLREEYRWEELAGVGEEASYAPEYKELEEARLTIKRKERA